MKFCCWNGTGLTMKFCLWNGMGLTMKFCHWNGIGFEHENLSLEWNRF